MQKLSFEICKYYGGDFNLDDFNNCYDIINKYTINKGYLPRSFFRDIKQCIVKNNRLLTLKNINNMSPDNILSLKKSFNPCSDKNKDKWVKLLN